MFLFKSNKYVSDKEKTYELFLDSIDDLSARRLRGIDMSFELFKDKLKDRGFDLTETACYGPTIDIKRNQLGFYVDESRALYSDTEFNNYQYGVKVFKEFKDDFERMHGILSEKEIIMNGYYKVKRFNADKLNNMSIKIGYGEKRSQVIHEDKPEHPSREFKKIEGILDKTRQSRVDYEAIIKQVIEIIQPYFIDKYEVMIKRENEKFDSSYDDSFGVMVKDKELGEFFMIYEIDGFDIKKGDYEKYLKKDCIYLEIYLRIITKCLKSELGLNY